MGKSNKEILEMHMGSDFWKIEESGYLHNILNAMDEYKTGEITDGEN